MSGTGPSRGTHLSNGTARHLADPECASGDAAVTSAPSTALAEGAWITKQSLGERRRRMETLGLVVTAADPDDGRARLVRRTARGSKARAATESAIAAMEAEWAMRVGADRFAVFRSVLEELAAWTDV
ncbi:MAG: MarR family winged helix-turn-helix transcriptional regulator [Ilumatobacteraceae bacterium]